MPWTNDELDKISAADELRISTLKQDGTLRNPVTIWVVCVGDSLFIRAIHGPDGKWYRHALESHRARIDAGGVTKDVELTAADSSTEVEVDAAYRSKYGRYGETIVGSTQTAKAKSATLKLIPWQ